MSFRRYPEYKDSGVEWLGEIPAHWEACRLAWLFSGAKRQGYADKDVLSVYRDHGVVPKDSRTDNNNKTPDDVSAYQLVLPGDLVVNKMKAWQGSLGVSAYEGITSPDYLVYSPSHAQSSRYLEYLLRSQRQVSVYRTISNGIRPEQWRIESHLFRAMLIMLPPVDEQHSIAMFLDAETAKNDALVAEQERLIELLKEKRQALISHAVTRGLNPSVPMKDSGIEWLGEIPAHWDVTSVRRVLQRIEQGWSPDCFARPADGDEWGVLKSGCVNRGVFVESENKALPGSLAPVPEFEVRPGDVLMSRASGSPELVGSTAQVVATRPKLMLSDKIFRVYLRFGFSPQFFVATFNSRVMRSQIERAISGADGLANNLPQSALRSFFLAVPPQVEQVAIAQFLETETAKLDALTTEAQRAIELLQERRSALISAAVTGKIDVR